MVIFNDMKRLILFLVISIFLAGCTLNRNINVSVNSSAENVNEQLAVNEIPVNNDQVVAEENKVSFDLGQEFILHENESASITNENLQVKVTKFYNSPCPKGVQCIWSGVGVELEYSQNGQQVKGIDLKQAFGYETTILWTDYETYAKLVVKKTAKVTFDHCGKLGEYSEPLQDWYVKFHSKLAENDINSKTIAEICVSLDKQMVIAIVEGSYCTPGVIYRYTVASDILAKAEFDNHDRACVAWPKEFGKRTGDIITLEGSGGDAGCSSKMYYDYNHLSNKIELKKECNKCEGETKESCHVY